MIFRVLLHTHQLLFQAIFALLPRFQTKLHDAVSVFCYLCLLSVIGKNKAQTSRTSKV